MSIAWLLLLKLQETHTPSNNINMFPKEQQLLMCQQTATKEHMRKAVHFLFQRPSLWLIPFKLPRKKKDNLFVL